MGLSIMGELEKADLSHEFLKAIEKEFVLEVPKDDWQPQGHGIDEVRKIAGEYGIDNINLIKPGIGETTRVLLRRVPWKILVNEKYKEDASLEHILRLAEEKSAGGVVSTGELQSLWTDKESGRCIKKTPKTVCFFQ